MILSYKRLDNALEDFLNINNKDFQELRVTYSVFSFYINMLFAFIFLFI